MIEWMSVNVCCCVCDRDEGAECSLLAPISCISPVLLFYTAFCHSFTQSEAVANHPNLWFQTSVNYHKLKNGKSITVPSTTGAAEAASASSSSGGGAADAMAMDTSTGVVEDAL